MKFKPVDANGKDLQLGDWVRVAAVPISIIGMHDDTHAAFSRAVGETLQIEGFDEMGCLELDFYPKLGNDKIWIEPFCVKRFRRYRKHSKRFQKILKTKKELELPEYIFTYQAIWPEQGKYEDCFDHFEYDDCDIGHGWAVWPDKRRIAGTFSIHKHKDNSLERIKKFRQTIKRLKYFDKIEVGEIQNRESKLSER